MFLAGLIVGFSEKKYLKASYVKISLAVQILIGWAVGGFAVRRAFITSRAKFPPGFFKISHFGDFPFGGHKLDDSFVAS